MKSTLQIVMVLLPILAPGVCAAGAPCPPLPPPSGTVVNVSTVGELENAVRNLADDTTILIAPGTYDLGQTLVVGGGVRNAAIRGATGNRDDVVILGRGMSNPNFGGVAHGFLVQAVDGFLIADLTVRDAYYHCIQVAGEHGVYGLHLRNLHLLDCGEQIVKGSTAGPPGPYADDAVVECSLIEYTDRAPSWYTNGVDVLAGARWTIRDNTFRNIRGPMGDLAGPAVLMWRNCIDTIVERNLFLDCDRAIALGLTAPDGNARDGETTYDHQGGLIRNNIIFRTAGANTPDVGITVNNSRDYRILHNTVILNGTFPWTIEYRFPASNGTVEGNLTDGPIFQRDGGGATLADNIDTAQPGWFVDHAGGDLHLTAAATCIDQAACSIEVSDDFDGELRPVGSLHDVGADEYGCTLPAAPIRNLSVARRGADLALAWDPEPDVAAYNVWTVDDAADADLARLSGLPTAQGVAGCSPPAPVMGPACTDTGAVGRPPPLFFFQVRAYCGGLAEGP